LGECVEQIRENISTMKLEERARADLAEANYQSHREQVLGATHVLEGENISLECVTVGSSHIEGGLNMGLVLQALLKNENLNLSTSVAHTKKVLPYY
jgi:hypothetical protein